MPAGRPALGIGEHGRISVAGSKKTWTAHCRYRDLDGVTRQVRAKATTKGGAERALQSRLVGRRILAGEGITPETTVRVLAEAWFTSVDESQSTKDAYRFMLDRHILPNLQGVRLREATTSRLEAFLRSVHQRGPSVARMCRVVLSLMFGMASRFDAVPANPVTDTKLRKQRKTEVVALSVDEVGALREHVGEWAAQRSNRAVMVDVVDLFIATGLRPGELLAVRYADVDLKARTLRVSGTVKRDSVNGLHRQPYPKSENGVRTLTLPEFAVSMIRRRKLAGTSALLFPNRNGEPVEPANFRRMWREARGEEWAHVEPRAFRRAVATLIEREVGSVVASQQLGHGSDAVTKRHYIASNHVAPDSSALLGAFRAYQGQ